MRFNMHSESYLLFPSDIVSQGLTSKQHSENTLNCPQFGKGDTALIYAARNGHGSTIQLLLERPDVRVNTAGTDGQTALICAAKNGRDRIVQLLLGRDEIKVNAVDRKGQTALILAARSGREKIVRLLLERDDIEIDEGRWDLHVNVPVKQGIRLSFVFAGLNFSF